ncbi:LCP family protein [Caldicellulosiruptoraceae bacterium PP1]
MKTKIKLKKQTKIFLISFLATIAVFFLIIAILFKIYSSGNNNSLPPIISGIFDKMGTVSDQEMKDNLPLNILLLGADSREAGRSDTMMLITIRKDLSVNIISIPRDTKVQIEGKPGYNKINAAFAYGKEKLAIKTVEELLNIKIDKYISVNYEAVKKIVDLVGGVDVDVPFHLYYVDTTPNKELYIDIPAGKQHLNGEKAIQFLRWRHNSNGKEYGPGGDLGRIELQKKLINSLIDKMLLPQNIIRFPIIINTVSKYTEQNFTRGEIMWFAENAKKINRDLMVMTTLPGKPQWIDKVSYYINDTQETKKLVEDIQEPEVNKDLLIKIYYNNKDNAEILKNKLIEHGFQNVSTERKWSKFDQDKIISKRINRNYINILKKELGEDINNFTILYQPDYNNKYDIIFEIK